VAVSGTLAYLASSFAGLEVVDVSDPVSPTLIGAYNSGESFAQDVAVSGNKVYIADYSGLRIVNVSDPTNPTELGFCDTPGVAEEVVVSGTLAYVADGDRGVSIVDVSNPFSPTLAGAFNTPGYAQEVAVMGSRIFVADGPNGLLILEPTPGGSALGAAAGLAQSQVTSDTLKTYLQAAARRPSNPVGSAAGVSAISAPEDVPAYHTSTGSEAHLLTIGSTCSVTSTADSGPGSLRECLENASGGTLVTFDPLVFRPTRPVTIALLTGLPPLGDGHVTIDASNAGVTLDGSATPVGTHGLEVNSDGNLIQGLQIVSFPGAGIFLGGNHNRIGGDRLIGSGPLGQGNLLSGNANSGLCLGEAMSNTVSGNLVGTDVHGTAAWGNGGFGGIFLAGEGCSHNTIGGRTSGERNIVSGNLTNGIGFSNRANGNLVIGNYVGTDISGSFDLGNRGHGIGLEVNSWNNWIEGNLSSGNVRAGLLADGGDYNTFVGNWVGTDATGTKAIPNDWCGVYVGSVSFTRVGGTCPGEGNLVSGGPCGIEVGGPGGNVGNLVLGNLVGTDRSGTLPLGNGSGVTLGAKGGRVILGGATTAERNVIGSTGCPGHWAMGVDVSGDYHFVAGNYIGTDISGTAPLGNCGDGIWMHGAEHCVIQGNVIAYNTGSGAYVESYASNTLRRNSIYGHPNPGILVGAANSSLPAPVVHAAAKTCVSGTACPGCTVEIFSDDEDEGRVYEGTTVADAEGRFSFSKAGGLTGPFVTATATDSEGNTSQFSSPRAVGENVYLPTVLKGW
jgi:parallel beta-helix repeat protein